MMVCRDSLGEWPTGGDKRLFTDIVVMGMGEPLFGADAWRRLRLAMDEEGPRRFRFGGSPCRLPAWYRRSSNAWRTRRRIYFISLHAVRDGLRDELVPVNRKWNIAKLLDACALSRPTAHHLRICRLLKG
ncbi:MAG: hypothetical protein R3D03_08155 [Geminicoccaceae bacterium]